MTGVPGKVVGKAVASVLTPDDANAASSVGSAASVNEAIAFWRAAVALTHSLKPCG